MVGLDELMVRQISTCHDSVQQERVHQAVIKHIGTSVVRAEISVAVVGCEHIHEIQLTAQSGEAGWLQSDGVIEISIPLLCDLQPASPLPNSGGPDCGDALSCGGQFSSWW